MLLNKGNSSDKPDEGEVEEFNWNAIKGTPFYAVGTEENGYTLTFAGMAIAKEKFKTAEAAAKYVARKPWDLILVATAVYRDLYEQAKNGEK